MTNLGKIAAMVFTGVVLVLAPGSSSTAQAVTQCSDGIDNDDDGLVDYPDDPGCTDALDNDETDPAANANPDAPVLSSPSDGALGVDGTSVTFEWEVATDPDADTVSYQFYLCTDVGFGGCDPISVAWIAMPPIQIAGMGGGMLVFAAGLFGAVRIRRKTLLLILLVALAWALAGACGGGSSDGGSSGPPSSGGSGSNVTYTVTGLRAGTTYYWKVASDDGNGGTTDSAVLWFTTAP